MYVEPLSKVKGEREQCCEGTAIIDHKEKV